MKRFRFGIGVLAVAVALVAITPATALSLTRQEAVARGMVWARYTRYVWPGVYVTGVPYSQSKWALESGSPVPTSAPEPSVAGYRTDCSGFASLCWNLRDSKGRPYSASTYTFGLNNSSLFKLVPLAKNDLEPGDMLLASAVWGATSPHAIIFNGWADDARTKFWALEQTKTSTHDGTILRIRSYGQAYYRPFRNIDLDDPYADCQDRIAQGDAVRDAALMSQAAFPTSTTVSVPAVVLVNSALKADQLSVAVLAGSVGGPMLLTSSASIPASTAAEITRLKPARIYILGATSRIGLTVEAQAGSFGVPVQRLGGRNEYEVANSASCVAVRNARANGRVIDTAYVTTPQNLLDALRIAPIAAKTGRPLLFVQPKGVPNTTVRALKALGIRRVIVLGSTKTVTRSAVLALQRKARARVTRIASSAQSVAVARHGAALGMSWKHLGLAGSTYYSDAIASAAAVGQMGEMIMVTSPKSLDSSVRTEYVIRRAAVGGRARVFGNAAAVSPRARYSLAAVLRATQ